MRDRQVIFLKIGCWAAAITAAVHMVGVLAGPQPPANETEKVLLDLAESYQFPLPGGAESRPYGMAKDGEDRVWVVQTSRPNQFVSFDTKTQKFSEPTAVPSGGGTVRHMYYDAASKSIWFGTDANTIGQAIVPPREEKPVP